MWNVFKLLRRYKRKCKHLAKSSKISQIFEKTFGEKKGEGKKSHSTTLKSMHKADIKVQRCLDNDKWTRVCLECVCVERT